MDLTQRLELALSGAFALVNGPDAPPRLKAAMHHAVFPGGGRIRPRLTLAVARACGDEASELADACACAIELLHCASLCHDDLPCFDDAAVRRARPSVHAAFGPELAVLAGDALVVLAFEVLGRAEPSHRVPALVTELAVGVGAGRGIIAGQGWESEVSAELERYHRTKTAALFEAAACAGALANGRDPEPWRRFGAALGKAYQIADDVADVSGDSNRVGKPVDQDARRGRLNAPTEWGVERALKRLELLMNSAIERIPACPGRPFLTSWALDACVSIRPTLLRPSSAPLM